MPTFSNRDDGPQRRIRSEVGNLLIGNTSSFRHSCASGESVSNWNSRVTEERVDLWRHAAELSNGGCKGPLGRVICPWDKVYTDALRDPMDMLLAARPQRTWRSRTRWVDCPWLGMRTWPGEGRGRGESKINAISGLDVRLPFASRAPGF